ncbi:uncharacterized protein PAC_11153 [Phialocephala subalpina]|uniref:2EXR domain-containing protein n=1 Tax=Phialocephala subalpina TaxID=576137 RepID=A0A1L7X8D7_9HELO|nr:uncharacterized protein PAC_11153 [Phialocephala subalpina]
MSRSGSDYPPSWTFPTEAEGMLRKRKESHDESSTPFIIPPPTFHLFSKLPTELRNILWEFASHNNSSPAIIPLSLSWEDGRTNGIVTIGRISSLYVQTDTAVKTPVLLHAAYETCSSGIKTVALTELNFRHIFKSHTPRMVMEGLNTIFVICKILHCSGGPGSYEDIEVVARVAREEKRKVLLGLAQFAQPVQVIVVGDIWEVEDQLFLKEGRRGPHRMHTVRPSLDRGRWINWERVEWDFGLRK